MSGIDLVIEPLYSLEETAGRISRTLGIQLSAELTGRYEEFPAFTAYRAGIDYALLGPPVPEHDVRDEPTNDYYLSVVPSRGVPESATAAELVSALRSAGLRAESVR
jgi:hypothetical protein